jgi:hypothetical protein
MAFISFPISAKRHKEKDQISHALTRPIVIQAAASILAFSKDKEEAAYTHIQDVQEETLLRDMTMSEINIRRYLISLKLGDQGDCMKIDSAVQDTINRDMNKREAILDHLKAAKSNPALAARYTADDYMAYYSSPDGEGITADYFTTS